MKIPLTLAMLTWNAPETLENTLKSYEKSGILDIVEQKIIFIQANGHAERDIAKKYGFKILYSKENIGIQAAYRKLLNMASSKYFLFCENDWLCVENKDTTLQRLKTAIDLIEKHNIKCVRLRHKYHFGEPLYTLQFKGDELKQPSHFLDCIHWLEDPSIQYPDIVKKLSINNENWFLTKAQNANYTNNPCIYNTNWIKKIVNKDYTKFLNKQDRQNIVNYAKIKGVKLQFIIFESCIQGWWEKQKFLVAQGIGLFEHHPVIIKKKKIPIYKKIIKILKK